MKKLFAFALALAWGWSGFCGEKSLKVLMIGNSFSRSVLQELPALAKQEGLRLDLCSMMIGGCLLERHWKNVEKAAQADFLPYGIQFSYATAEDLPRVSKAVTNRKSNIPQMLVADKWDVVTIQQGSHGSAFYKTYQPYADNLVAKIRELAPQAEIVVQETWSYTPYDGRLKAWEMTPGEMHAALKEAYATLAAKHGLRTIPTGDAVQLFRTRRPVVYAKVLTKGERAALVKPSVPEFYGDVAGAAVWGKGRPGKPDADEIKLRIDPSHLNPRGCYLQACVWAGVLFKTDPTRFTYRPAVVSEADATLMRACAREAIAALKKGAE